MSRLNLVARIDSSFPDKTAYKRVLDTGEIVWENSKGREKWRWIPMIVEGAIQERTISRNGNRAESPSVQAGLPQSTPTVRVYSCA